MAKITDLEQLDLLSREEILQLPINRLSINLAGSWQEKAIHQLYRELAKKGLDFRPHIWVSDDWFCPDGIPGFAIPFYLFHPNLIALEEEFNGEAEGSNPQWFMKLLRHECGHALENAFRIRRRRERQKLFGLSSTPYPNQYTALPYSRRFVRHLEGHYAQAHPDEDFAETFALWLTPRSNWKKSYRHWPAMKKLLYIDRLAEELHLKTADNSSREVVSPLTEIDETLERYWNKRLRRRQRLAPSFFQNKLSQFTTTQERSHPKAASFFRSRRKELVRIVAKNSGRPLYQIDQLYRQIIDQCHQKSESAPLYLRTKPVQAERKLVSLLTRESIKFIKEDKHKVLM